MDSNGMEFYGSKEIIPWFSPSNSYIMITPDADEVACGAKATFDISYTFNVTKPANLKFFYLVSPLHIYQLHIPNNVNFSSNLGEKLFTRAIKV
jgi:hypothetical protein